eukprot:m.134719 g.134719  ORF g.134719 m.134719 type:complete len:348 (+) comp16922_c0_seq1:2679-3722(+)
MQHQTRLSRATTQKEDHHTQHLSTRLPATMLFQSILKTIGRTPIVRMNRLAPAHVNLFAKCEFFNPGGSVKDRLAIALIEDAERKGQIKPGDTILEATSGNTGVSLAMVCAAKGYKFVAVMAESFSIERRKIMKMYGAKVVLTPKELAGTGMLDKMDELHEKYGWFTTRQFDNPANPIYHRNTTASEILLDFTGERLDYWVTGYGTGGTMSGAGAALKEARDDVKVVMTEPASAPRLSGDSWQPHKIQGWTPDFVPSVLDRTVYDEVELVTEDEAIETARLLAQKEGVFVGISAGGTLAAALKVAERAPEGSNILAMLPDTGERYLTTPLFENISEECDEASLTANF